MKKIGLILFLSIPFIGYSQKYQITYTGSAEAEPCDPDPIRNSIDQITLSNLSGIILVPLLSANCNNLVDTATKEVSIINFLPNRAIKKKYAENLNGSVFVDEFKEVLVSFNHCDSKTITFPGSGNVFQVEIEPYTQINSQPINNTLCEVTLSVDEDGFEPEVYVWQYFDSISSQWANFPNDLLGSHQVTFKLEDLFGNQASNYHNTNIKFRMQKYCTGKYTNIVTYTMISCSPQLLSFTPSNTQCSYTDDGSFSMILDRDLASGKKLVTSLFFEFEPVTKPTVFNLLDQKDTTVLIDNGDGTYTYQWPSDTPILPGNYKVRYQTYDTTASNPVWDSLEGTEDGFVIGNPPPITFSATKQNDVYCKGGSDGDIQLNASGGVGGFKYELNNSGTWIPFAASNTHNITGLPKGTKTIKVQDGNRCTQKE